MLPSRPRPPGISSKSEGSCDRPISTESCRRVDWLRAPASASLWSGMLAQRVAMKASTKIWAKWATMQGMAIKPGSPSSGGIAARTAIAMGSVFWEAMMTTARNCSSGRRRRVQPPQLKTRKRAWIARARERTRRMETAPAPFKRAAELEIFIHGISISAPLEKRESACLCAARKLRRLTESSRMPLPSARGTRIKMSSFERRATGSILTSVSPSTAGSGLVSS
mmetsp:Transcript_40581/g.100263  ORF Transcript_40581/g.100263 Transcript_40581/m.100263 type:complete len:224 (-) Transcript_40581:131-802(-)